MKGVEEGEGLRCQGRGREKIPILVRLECREVGYNERVCNH